MIEEKSWRTPGGGPGMGRRQEEFGEGKKSFPGDFYVLTILSHAGNPMGKFGKCL